MPESTLYPGTIYYSHSRLFLLPPRSRTNITTDYHTTMEKSNLPSVEGIDLIDYVDESQLDDVMRLVGQDLSEPYSSEYLTQ